MNQRSPDGLYSSVPNKSSQMGSAPEPGSESQTFPYSSGAASPNAQPNTTTGPWSNPGVGQQMPTAIPHVHTHGIQVQYQSVNPQSQYYYQGAIPTPGYPAGYGYQPLVRETNGFAVASLITGILGLFTIIVAPAGIVFGILALRSINRTGESGRGMAIAGLVLGSIISALVLLYIVLVVFLLVSY